MAKQRMLENGNRKSNVSKLWIWLELHEVDRKRRIDWIDWLNLLLLVVAFLIHPWYTYDMVIVDSLTVTRDYFWEVLYEERRIYD